MRLKMVFSAVPLESETVSQLFRRGIAAQASNPKVEEQLIRGKKKYKKGHLPAAEKKKYKKGHFGFGGLIRCR